MRVPICVVLLSAAAWAVPAYANAPQPKEARAEFSRFNSIDRNMDGGISAHELNVLGKVRGADTLFSLLAGPDGRIAINNVARGNPALMARLDAYDVNKDGYVTRREFPNFVDPVLVSALDVNHDGKISLAELQPAFAGSQAHTPRTQPRAPVRMAKEAPKPQPWCWVPGPGVAPWLGDRHWFVQVPVVLSPDCRTR